MDKLRVSKVEDVFLQRGAECQKGSLHLTQHHLIFTASNASEEQWIPYALLSLVTRQASLLPLTHRRPASPQGSAFSSSSSRSGRIYPLQLRFRTFDAASLGFDSEAKATDVFESLKAVAVITQPEKVYAFYYTPQPPSDYPEAWSIYDFKAEFTRQGVGSRSKAWRFSDINVKYELCPTYPALFAVPSRISDATLQYAAKYRSKGRIPTLTYLHWANGGSITRCAQPLPGLKQARSVQDEKVVEAIFSSHSFAGTETGSPSGGIGAVYGATTTNLIVDARPTTNAVATYARGGGTENMDHYKGCRKAYMGIENIHVMRDSINRIVDALRAADEPTTFGLDVRVEAENYNNSEGNDSDVGSSKPRRVAPARQPLDIAALKRSNWLRHLATLLEGAALITRNVHIASSHAMVHCSDGWDRTSQLAALAEVCLDPYYRTMKGFAVLVEKDWLSFGHRFADRCGHGGFVKHFVTAAGHAESSEEEDGDDPEGVVNAPQAAGGASAAANAFWGFTKQLTSNFGGGGGEGHGNIKETSPVFTQFLDCVWQIRRQFPGRFEFNDDWLSALHRELYECRFGTFLANCERERELPTEVGGKSVMERTHSVWEYMLSESNRTRFLNSQYSPSLDDPKRADADMGVLLIKSNDVRWWSGVFGERIEEANAALDFEESERKRRKAEKARWEEERLKERERKDAEERRLLEEQRKEALLHSQMSSEGTGSAISNSSGSKGAVDLMTASQLQAGNSGIDPSKLAYKPRASPSPANRSAATLPSGSRNAPPSTQQPIDAAARFKSWAIGGWDRLQEVVSAGSTDENNLSSSSSSSSFQQVQRSHQHPQARDPLGSSNPWAASESDSVAARGSRGGSPATQPSYSEDAYARSGSASRERNIRPQQHQHQLQSQTHARPSTNLNPWRDDEVTSASMRETGGRERPVAAVKALPNGLESSMGALDVGDSGGGTRGRAGPGTGGDSGATGRGTEQTALQQGQQGQQQQQQREASKEFDPLGVGF